MQEALETSYDYSFAPEKNKSLSPNWHTLNL